jgi:hypothetical protein
MIGKNGIIKENNFIELVHTEPDGSKWLHVFHHNNPAAQLFSNSDDFENGVHKNNDMWFLVHYCKNFTKWEFLWIQTIEESSVATKYRWIQSVSPFGTSYDAVKPASVTRVTTAGYTDGNFGGLYKMNSNTYLAIANTSNGNWFGATGSWSAHGNGTPGYPNTSVGSGCMDLYIRIDNTTIPDGVLNVKIKKDLMQSNNFVEM